VAVQSAAPAKAPAAHDAPDEIEGGDLTVDAPKRAQVLTHVSPGLRLRAGDSLHAHIIDVMPRNAELTILPGTTHNGFFKVQFRGHVGYAHSSCIGILGDAPAPASHADEALAESGEITVERTKLGEVVTQHDGLRLHAAPSLRSPALLLLPKGAQVKVLPATAPSGLFKVEYHGHVGYAHSAYIAIRGDAAPAAEEAPEHRNTPPPTQARGGLLA
jgi:hypothetical protein